jgi:hypothetical protein
MSAFSDPCLAGTFKANGMTTCQTCPTGKESNSDKTDCGKRVFNNYLKNIVDEYTYMQIVINILRNCSMLCIIIIYVMYSNDNIYIYIYYV